MRCVLLVALAILLAGCASPATTPSPSTPAPEGPVELSGRAGLVAIDVDQGTIEVLSDEGTVGWISPSGHQVVWNEGAYAIALDTQTGARDVVATVRLARLYDNGTGLEIHEGEARWRDPRAPAANATATVPPAPRPGSAWTQASDDLTVLGVEYSAGNAACANEIFVRAANGSKTTGCHLRVAADGRAGWSELGTVRVRAPGGDIATMEPASNDTRLENPVFTAEGLLHLRVHGQAGPTLTEVVDEDGAVVAKLTGSGRLALLDATADGKVLLANVFRGT